LSSAPLPAWVFEGPVAEKGGVHTAEGSWSAASQTFVPRSTLSVYERQPFRAPVLGAGAIDGRTAGTTFHEDDSVRIWHQDDEVLVISLKTKMHVISPDVINGFKKALAEAEKNFKGLVIWNADAAEGGAFSAGADLQSALPAFMHVHVAEIRECAGGRCRGWPGAGRRLRAGAACVEARGIDRIVHRPGGSGRGPDSCRRRPEGSGIARF
jgi:hypothetical protein